MPNVSPCPHHQPDTIWDYNGTIGREKARLTLQLSGEQLTGLYFYYADLADLPVRGRVSSDRRVELTQVRSDGSSAGSFVGSFVHRDPRNRAGNNVLECELFIGIWKATGSSVTEPVVFDEVDGATADLRHRYANATALSDDEIDSIAQKLWLAIRQSDKPAVARLIEYPLSVSISGRRVRLNSEKEMVARYDEVFTRQYREAILSDAPHNMWANVIGVAFSDGLIWFGADGRVIALNNVARRR